MLSLDVMRQLGLRHFYWNLLFFLGKKKKKPGVSSNEIITVYRGGDVTEITVNPIGYCIIYNVGCFYFINFGR